MDNLNLDKMIDRIMAGLPNGISTFSKEAEHNLKAALRSVLSKMDLVTREEFDVQRDVLARTRAKLEALEKQVEEIEEKGRVTSNK